MRFGPFTFDPATGEIDGPGGSRRLQPQPAAVLALIVAGNGELVSREKLRDEVWSDTKVEFDQAINYCIRQIRTALGESADEPHYIETLPRRGYRLLVPVEGGAPAATVGRSARRRAAIWAGAVTLALAAAIAALLMLTRGGSGLGPRVVLLPLGGPAEASGALADFGGALEEALVIALTAADARHLRVVGPLTTAPLVRGGADVARIGVTLDADYLVSGEIRVADSTVFIQVVRRGDGAHVVAERYPIREVAPHAIADDLARALVVVVRADAEGAPARR